MHSNGIETGLPSDGLGRNVSDLWTLIGDALGICQAVEPELGSVLARLLNLEMAGANPPALGGSEAADLITCLRMLVYARANAQTMADASSFLPRLELCIGCLTQHVQLAHVGRQNVEALSS